LSRLVGFFAEAVRDSRVQKQLRDLADENTLRKPYLVGNRLRMIQKDYKAREGKRLTAQT